MNPDALSPVSLFGRAVRRVHALGVGGMGLGPLSIYMAGLGLEVSGSDDHLSPVMRRQLRKAGATILPADGFPEDADLVVISSAIHADHPALPRARSLGVPIVRRGELLAELAKGRRLLAVCGSHGKTTTTALLAVLLGEAGFPAGYVLGGLLNDESIPPARVGTGEWLVAEVDESDGTIEAFAPEVCVLLNFDWDHPDHYREPGNLETTLVALMRRTRGAVLTKAGCAVSARLVAAAGRELLTFGEGGDFALRSASPDADGLRLELGGKFGADEIRVRAWGAFNALNAVAASAAAVVMGAKLRADLLARFPGVYRRQMPLEARPGENVIEDYAHHPAELAALFGGLRARHGQGSLRVVFQPHRFSRTRQFKADFAEVFARGGLAELVLLDVYGAGEDVLAGGGTADLAECIRRLAPALPLTLLARGNEAAGLAELGERVRPGDVIAFVGAGDVGAWGQRWAAKRRWDALAEKLRAAVSAGTPVKREEAIAKKTTMRVGGAARIYAEPALLEDLQALLRAAKANGIPVWLMGRGSNLIVADEGVDGLVISLRHPVWERIESLPGGAFRVGAGVRLKALCGQALKSGVGGFEFLEGIPGNVGGALRMNAGAMGGWMFDVVESVDLLSLDGELTTLSADQMHVGYRHCKELERAIAVGAILRPRRSLPLEEAARQLDTYRDKRKCSQPREPSAGCIFKNPEGDSAGRLIDSAGLKGLRVGGAEVSPIHANFIINRGDATAADVIALVQKIRGQVRKTHGVWLEPEALLYGANWNEVL